MPRPASGYRKFESGSTVHRCLGKRDLLWELVPDLIEKNVIAVEVDGNAE